MTNVRYVQGVSLLAQVRFSEHATTRMAQRRLTTDDVLYVIQHGQVIYNGGACHVFLRRRDIPVEDRRIANRARLEGTTVLLDSQTVQTVVTVYRNRAALKDISRKVKYSLNKAR